jgi:hypothetical protein
MFNKFLYSTTLLDKFSKSEGDFYFVPKNYHDTRPKEYFDIETAISYYKFPRIRDVHCTQYFLFIIFFITLSLFLISAITFISTLKNVQFSLRLAISFLLISICLFPLIYCTQLTCILIDLFEIPY